MQHSKATSTLLGYTQVIGLTMNVNDLCKHDMIVVCPRDILQSMLLLSKIKVIM